MRKASDIYSLRFREADLRDIKQRGGRRYIERCLADPRSFEVPAIQGSRHTRGEGYVSWSVALPVAQVSRVILQGGSAWARNVVVRALAENWENDWEIPPRQSRHYRIGTQLRRDIAKLDLTVYALEKTP